MVIKNFISFSVFFLLLLSLNCTTVSTEESIDFNAIALKQVRLKMSENDFEDIYKNELVNEWLPAMLENDYIIFRCHGNTAREDPKPSFKAEIGDNLVIYSAQYKDKSFCRYRLTDFLFKKAGFETSRLRPILFFINDNFMGLYLEREGVNEKYFNDRNIRISSLYKANSGVEFTFDHGLNVYSAFKKKIPDNDLCYTDLERLIEIIDEDIEEKENIFRLEQILDVYNALDYYAVSTLASSYDCIRFNYYLAFNLSSKKFEFVPWDLDRTFSGAEEELPEYENGLFEKLLEYKPYKQYFQKRLIELFNKEELLNELNSYYKEIKEAYSIDPHLEGIQVLENEVKDIEKYILRVEKHLLEQEEDDDDDDD